MVAVKRQDNEDFDPFDLGSIPGVDVLSPEEGRVFFDEQARKELGISGEEFLKRWDAGLYRPIPDDPEGWKIGRMVMMLPFVRPTPR
jgi:hypothetical protein